MKGFIVGLLLGLMATAAAEVTIARWQDLQPYIAQLANKVNAQDAKIAALQNEVATLKTRVNVAENSYNILVYYLLTQACYANSMQPTWLTSLTGLKPFPLGDAQCPPAGETIYVPGFIGGQQAVLKPPQ